MRKINVDENLEEADWIKRVRNAQQEDLAAHDEALKEHEEEAEE